MLMLLLVGIVILVVLLFAAGLLVRGRRDRPLPVAYIDSRRSRT